MIGKRKILELLALASMFTPPEDNRVERIMAHKDYDDTKPIPKGCKEYFFKESGYFDNERMRKDECVFKCIALNDKSAEKKYDKWRASKKNA